MGGNAFNNIEIIKKENINPTINKFFEELNRIYPNINFEYKLLGSTGKKDYSGDIDVGIDINLFLNEDDTPKLKEWDIKSEEFYEKFDDFYKVSKTSTRKQTIIKTILFFISSRINKESSEIESNSKSISLWTLFNKFNQYDINNKLEKYVQIDLMVGNLKWLEYSLYTDVYSDNTVKGYHRNLLLAALFSNKEFSLNPSFGLKKKSDNSFISDDPNEIINILNDIYNISLDYNISLNYFDLLSKLKENLNENDYNDIIQIYFKKINMRSSSVVPSNFISKWKENNEKWNLKMSKITGEK